MNDMIRQRKIEVAPGCDGLYNVEERIHYISRIYDKTQWETIAERIPLSEGLKLLQGRD